MSTTTSPAALPMWRMLCGICIGLTLCGLLPLQVPLRMPQLHCRCTSSHPVFGTPAGSWPDSFSKHKALKEIHITEVPLTGQLQKIQLPATLQKLTLANTPLLTGRFLVQKYEGDMHVCQLVVRHAILLRAAWARCLFH